MNILNKIIAEIFNPFIGLLFIAAIVVFIWGVIEFILGAENEEKRTTGKQHILYGLIGLAIMSAVWGIIEVLRNFVSFEQFFY